VRGVELSVGDRVPSGLVAATGLTRHVRYDCEGPRPLVGAGILSMFTVGFVAMS